MSERTWIARIDDQALRERVRKVLVQLLVLAEADSASPPPAPPDKAKVRGKGKEGMKANKAQGHHESQIPPGVRLDRSPTQAPRLEDSMYEHFIWRFRRAFSPLALEVLCEEAERELQWHKTGLPEGAMALVATYDEDRDRRILFGEGEGVPAEVMAVRHSWPVGWVRITRERNGMDAQHGHPRPNWRELLEEERYGLVEGLRREGKSQREVAMRLGISKGSAQRYWKREEVA